jgi:hypothetical protein
MGDGYVELFERIFAPALLGSSYDVKESGKQQTATRRPEK